MFYSSILHTPLGYMRAMTNDKAVYKLDWQQTPFILHPDAPAARQNDVSRETIHQLDAYLNGRLGSFTVPIDLSSLTVSLQRWLKILQTVPYGTTISYAEFAEKWGNRKAARAAGGACQRNPLPILIPCHRILKGDGSYDNYSGGDSKNPRHPDNIHIKQWLIEMEAKSSPPL